MNAALQIPPSVLGLANPESPERVALEAVLGARSFRAFFRMAWRHIDPAPLSWNWHYDLLCETMEAAARREIRELVLAVPPRTGKSSIVSVAYNAWVWTWHPAAKFITASNELTLATRDAVRTRRLVQSEWYQKRWGPGSRFLPPGHPGVDFQGDQNNKTYFETTAGGHRFCATPGRMVTGHGGDFILADDVNNPQTVESDVTRTEVQNWWFETIPSRLNEIDRGVKIVIQQRVHREDLAGACIKRGYHHVVLPMEFEPDHPERNAKDPRTEVGELLHPSRMGPSGVEILKRSMGTYAWAAQGQQRPVPREGGLFKREHFRVVDAVPAEVWHNSARHWDLAATVPVANKKPDWTASVRMGRDAIGRVYILHAVHFQESPSKVDEAIKATASQELGVRLSLPLDPGAAGIGRMEAQSRFLAPYAAEFIRETGDKATRARGLATMAEAGNVFVLRGSWNEELISELCDFPNGSHDDYVDAAANAFARLYADHEGLMEFLRSQVGDADPNALTDQRNEVFQTQKIHLG